MSFTAKYRGDCGSCDEPIEPGDECDWLRVPGDKDMIIHVKCPEVVPVAAGVACTSCFTIHAPNQKECW